MNPADPAPAERAHPTLWRVLGIALSWTPVWLAFWALVMAIIGVVDPDSIDPGEPAGMLRVFGSMGLLSGIAIGIGLSAGSHGRSSAELPLQRVLACGFLGCALVQILYLGHGDDGLAANLQLASVFSAVGALVTLVWRAGARRWMRRRAALEPRA